MSHKDSREAPRFRGRSTAIIRSIWGLGSWHLAAFGTVLTFVLMAIIFSDVVARNLFNASLA